VCGARISRDARGAERDAAILEADGDERERERDDEGRGDGERRTPTLWRR